MSAAWITVGPGLDIGLDKTGRVAVRLGGNSITLLAYNADAAGHLLLDLAASARRGCKACRSLVETDAAPLKARFRDAVEGKRDVDQSAASIDGFADLLGQAVQVDILDQGVLPAAVVRGDAHDDSLSHGSVGTAEGKGARPGAAETSRLAGDVGVIDFIRRGLDLIEQYGVRS